MSEIIVKMTGDHIKVKGGEYVQDLVKCSECKFSVIEGDKTEGTYYRWCNWIGHEVDSDCFCSWGEVRDE